ncbi:MAG: hypothetical protein WAV18_31415, partial [Roseiarcus sp.]
VGYGGVRATAGIVVSGARLSRRLRLRRRQSLIGRDAVRSGGGIVVHSGMIAIGVPSANGRGQRCAGGPVRRRVEHPLVGSADFRLAPGK